MARAQVVAILAAGQELPFRVDAVKLELPELQVRGSQRCRQRALGAAGLPGLAAGSGDQSGSCYY